MLGLVSLVHLHTYDRMLKENKHKKDGHFPKNFMLLREVVTQSNVQAKKKHRGAIGGACVTVCTPS